MKTIRLALESLLPIRNRGLILVYHRVASPRQDPYGLCTPPELFRRHLEQIGERCVRLTDLLQQPGTGRVALCFDDGYADCFDAALPLLAEFGLPATFFLTCQTEPFWWDELAARLLDPETAAGAWRLWQRPPTAEARYLKRVYAFLLENPDSEEGLLPALRDRFEYRSPPPRPMSLEQQRALAGLPGITVGAHSRRHPALDRLEPETLEREVAGCRTELESRLNTRVELFAYPFGRHSQRVRQTVEQAGFTHGLGVRAGFVTRWSDPYRIPRWSADGLRPEILRSGLNLLCPSKG